MEIVDKNLWIGLLEYKQREEINFKLYNALKSTGEYDEQEIDYLLSEGMDSRLSDLDSVIDIHELQLTQIN